MAFTRDLGIQFPSDATQPSPNSPLISRQLYNYLARGSRFRRRFDTLGSGIPLQLGFTFFDTLMPTMGLSSPDPIPYTQVIDVRKTKVVDSLQETLLNQKKGNAEVRESNLTGSIRVRKDPSDNRGMIESSVTFPAVLLGANHTQVVGGETIYLHDWAEVVFDHAQQNFQFKVGGYASENNSLKAAIHMPSRGTLPVTGQVVVQMTLVKSINGQWAATFEWGDAAANVRVCKTFAHTGSINATYDVQTISNPVVVRYGISPINRVLQDINYVFAPDGSLCTLLYDTAAEDYSLVLYGETVITQACNPGQVTNAELNAAESMRQIALNSAINAAI